MNLMLFIIILYVSFFAGSLIIRKLEYRRNFPYVTTIIFGFTAILGTFQVVFPAILAVLGREPQKFVHGEWWRIVTPLFVQDGGLAGLLSNLLFLVILGYSAERLYTRKKWLVLYFGTGILAECVAYLWQLQGAGNSIANAGLASGLLIFAVFQVNIPIRLIGIIGIVLSVILGVLGELHGVALIFGTIIAFIMY